MSGRERILEVRIVFGEEVDPYICSDIDSGAADVIDYEDVGERMLEILRRHGADIPDEAEVSGHSVVVLCAMEEAWGEIVFYLELVDEPGGNPEQNVRKTLERCFKCKIILDDWLFELEDELRRSLEAVARIGRCEWWVDADL